MPLTLRAAPRNAICRSSARAAEASCNVSSTQPGSSGSGEPCTVTLRLVQPRALEASGRDRRSVASLRADLRDQRNSGLSSGTRALQPQLRELGREMPRNCSAAWLA